MGSNVANIAVEAISGVIGTWIRREKRDSGLKRLQFGSPGENRFCESFYHRRRSQSEHGTILWAGHYARNEEQLKLEREVGGSTKIPTPRQ
jgi:hypothetical protein